MRHGASRNDGRHSRPLRRVLNFIVSAAIGTRKVSPVTKSLLDEPEKALAISSSRPRVRAAVASGEPSG